MARVVLAVGGGESLVRVRRGRGLFSRIFAGVSHAPALFVLFWSFCLLVGRIGVIRNRARGRRRGHGAARGRRRSRLRMGVSADAQPRGGGARALFAQRRALSAADLSTLVLMASRRSEIEGLALVFARGWLHQHLVDTVTVHVQLLETRTFVHDVLAGDGEVAVDV